MSYLKRRIILEDKFEHFLIVFCIQINNQCDVSYANMLGITKILIFSVFLAEEQEKANQMAEDEHVSED